MLSAADGLFSAAFFLVSVCAEEFLDEAAFSLLGAGSLLDGELSLLGAGSLLDGELSLPGSESPLDEEELPWLFEDEFVDGPELPRSEPVPLPDGPELPFSDPVALPDALVLSFSGGWEVSGRSGLPLSVGLEPSPDAPPSWLLPGASPDFPPRFAGDPGSRPISTIFG